MMTSNIFNASILPSWLLCLALLAMPMTGRTAESPVQCRETDDAITRITKTGTATWTLTGLCRHSGETVVEAGTLCLAATGSISNNAPVTVQPGATFCLHGGNAQVDNLHVQANASLHSSGGVIRGDLFNQGVVIENFERRFQTVRHDGNRVTLTTMGHLGHSYHLDWTTAPDGLWSSVGAGMSGADAVLTFVHDLPPGTRGGIYRLRVVP